MRFQPPGGSPFFEALIIAGKNRRLNEFQVETLNRAVQAFVPVQESTRLLFVVKANEIMKGSVIEVVVDGILRDTYVHQKKQSGDVRLHFDSGIYKSGKSLRRGKFTVHPCPSAVPDHTVGSARLGSIELRLYRAHSSSEASCARDVPDPEETNTYQELALPWNTFNVKPDCDITLSGEGILNQSKRISCRKAMSMERPGHMAWSTLRFIYRTAEALRREGIMDLEDAESEPIMSLIESGYDGNEEDDDYMSRDLIKMESSLDDGASGGGPDLRRKRKHDEIEDMVDQITFGPDLPNDVAGSTSSRYNTPSKLSLAEVEALEDEVRRVKAVAAENTRRAQAARAKLAERIRKRTELDRRYDELLAEKKKAEEQIAKSNQDEELYMRQLNNDESD